MEKRNFAILTIGNMKKLSLITLLLAILMFSMLPLVYSDPVLPDTSYLGSPEITIMVSPGEVRLEGFLVTVEELHRKWYPIVNITWEDYPGWYIFEIYVDVHNPSNKWRHVSGMEHAQLAPLGVWEDDTFYCYPDPQYRIVNRTQYLTNTITIYCRFYAVDKGWIAFYMTSFAVIDDFNGDGKIDIRDIFMIAMQYGKEYRSLDSPLAQYDMDFDMVIDYFDIRQVALDFWI